MSMRPRPEVELVAEPHELGRPVHDAAPEPAPHGRQARGGRLAQVRRRSHRRSPRDPVKHPSPGSTHGDACTVERVRRRGMRLVVPQRHRRAAGVKASPELSSRRRLSPRRVRTSSALCRDRTHARPRAARSSNVSRSWSNHSMASSVRSHMSDDVGVRDDRRVLGQHVLLGTVAREAHDVATGGHRLGSGQPDALALGAEQEDGRATELRRRPAAGSCRRSARSPSPSSRPDRRRSWTAPRRSSRRRRGISAIRLSFAAAGTSPRSAPARCGAGSPV